MKRVYRGNYTLYLVRDGKPVEVDKFTSWFEAASVLHFFLKDNKTNG